MKTLKLISDVVNKAITYIGITVMIFLIILVSVDVFSRYFFSYSFSWSEEVSLISLIWLTFITMAIGVKEGLHISITLFTNRLSKKLQEIILKFNDLLMLVFSIFLTVYGYHLTSISFTSTLPATGFPTAILYLAMPFSGVIIFVNTVLDLFSVVKMEVSQTEVEEALSRLEDEEKEG